MKAKEDIILIQEKLNDILGMMGSKSSTSKSSTSNSYENESYSNGDGATKGDTLTIVGTSPWPIPKKIIIKEKTIITKTEAPKNAKSMIDSLLQITKKYNKKK